MRVLSKSEIAALSPEQRLALIDDLWESIDALHPSVSSCVGSISDWQCRIVDERLLDLERFPEDDLGRPEARGQSLL
jgi:hypothetical protein